MLTSPLLNARRRWHQSRLPENALKAFYQHSFPAGGHEVGSVQFLSLDLETTGLDPNKDAIISAGWVVMDAQKVHLGSSEHHLIKPPSDIPEQSAIIHAITDDVAAQGEELCSVLATLLEALHGKVLLAHNASIEQGFIHAACKHCFQGPFFVPTVDTLQLALRRLRRRDQMPQSGELRLGALREQYHLPRYKAHNALTDALATAELFLAQLAHWAKGDRTKLKHLLR